MELGSITNFGGTPQGNRSESYSGLSLKKLFLITLLFTSVFGGVNTWRCPTPPGSYLKTCDVINKHSYTSVDPKLSKVPFCAYEVSCQKVGTNARRESTIYISSDLLNCAGQHLENCDGYPVINEDSNRMCTTQESIKKRLQDEL